MIKTGVVPEFKGEYFFLSNFYEADFRWRNEMFKSGEQAFQYAKTFHVKGGPAAQSEWHDKFMSAPTPAKAKYHGRSIPINLEEWDSRKVSYMREIVHAKFGYVLGLAGQLINTGAMLLVEGNDWGDTFWGRSRNAEGKIVGLNTLGTILMEERGYWLYSNFEDKRNDPPWEV